MKKRVCLMLIAILLPGCCAAAEQAVILPNSHYEVLVPDWMDYSDPVDGDQGVEAYVSKDLEMNYISYTREQAAERGLKDTLKESARFLKESGTKAELRKVQGVEMLCYRVQDPADDAPCVGYVFVDGDWLIEVDFWYATQEAADTAKTIMETIREVQE